ncbi:MAG: dockerin type I domain-containing protein [Bacteroidales bacterium]
MKKIFFLFSALVFCTALFAQSQLTPQQAEEAGIQPEHTTIQDAGLIPDMPATNKAAVSRDDLQGDYLAVISMPTNNKRVVLLDIFDGSVVIDNFIDLQATAAGTPKDVIQVGDEIWVCDQIGDRIDRFDMTGGHLGVIGAAGGLDNVRGMGIIGDEVWLSNAGTANGAPGNATIRISFDGEILGHFLVDGSPWDYIVYNGEALLSFSAAGGYLSRIERYDFNGNALGSWNTPGELNFIQQIAIMDNDHILAAGFSTPAGVYEYDTQGTLVGMIPGTNSGPRGCYQLGNGNILWTNSNGINIVDINTGVNTVAVPGNAQLCDKITFGFELLPGDANGDGTVDALDIITIASYVMGLDPQPFIFDNADVNQDGVINLLDVIATANIILVK